MNPEANDTKAHTRGLVLLQEWPSSKQTKQVTFSKYSMSRVFKCNSTNNLNMFYTSTDYKMFRAEAEQEGLRIYQLTSRLPLTRGKAIYHLIKHNLLSTEELLGIEQYIGKDSGLRKFYETCTHAEKVLAMQNALHEKSEESNDKLAQVAMVSSSKSGQQAYMRGLLAV